MRYAILASLLLHVLLLWPAPLRPPAQETRGLLQATVRLPQPLPAAEHPRPAPPRAVPPAPTVATKPLASLAQPLEAPRPLSVPAPSVPAPPVVASASPTTASSGSPVSSPPGGATTAAAATGSSLAANPATGEALDGLRGYRLAIASQARRFKRYPAEARASGWAGSTEVRLEVGVEGQVRPATVSRSSGHEALDRAALAMIDAGAARARLPDALRGRNFAVTLPVVFDLDEE